MSDLIELAPMPSHSLRETDDDDAYNETLLSSTDAEDADALKHADGEHERGQDDTVGGEEGSLLLHGWRRAGGDPSMAEAFHSIEVPQGKGWFRKILAFIGPGYCIAVGYMDAGNWSTNIAAGSAYEYNLLFVIIISNLIAMLLQALCVRLGMATQRDLAQACRDAYAPRIVYVLWFTAELAIMATDLAEVIGTAIALKLLFHIPLAAGVCITAVDVLIVMWLQNKRFRIIELMVILLIFTIIACFAAELGLSKPNGADVAWGLLPSRLVVDNSDALYISIGILGATVMPHNLYLHSSIVQTRDCAKTPAALKQAIRYFTVDSSVALVLALFVNAAILIVAGATFYTSGNHDVQLLEDAYELLTPLLGTTVGSTLFAVALLASGQNSTLTGTMAGQVVMEGFLQFRISPVWRRLVTRLTAIVPAALTAVIAGPSGVNKLLILSQVVLSFQLPFAVIPLVLLTSSKEKMGAHVNPMLITVLAWACALLITGLNLYLLVVTFQDL